MSGSRLEWGWGFVAKAFRAPLMPQLWWLWPFPESLSKNPLAFPRDLFDFRPLTRNRPTHPPPNAKLKTKAKRKSSGSLHLSFPACLKRYLPRDAATSLLFIRAVPQIREDRSLWISAFTLLGSEQEENHTVSCATNNNNSGLLVPIHWNRISKREEAMRKANV